MRAPRWPAIAVILLALIVGLLFDGDPRQRSVVRADELSLSSAVAGASVGSDVWYCAAGTATEGGAADVSVVLINVGAEPRTATITAAGARVTPPAAIPRASRSVSLPPYGRVDLRLATLVPGAAYAAATVEISGGGVVVEHIVQGPLGSDRAPCLSATSQQWFVPIAATATERNPSARAWLAVYNPFADDAVVKVEFAAEGAVSAPPIEGRVVLGRSVELIDLTAAVPVANQIATKVTVGSGRVVVERIELFDDPRRRDLVLTPAVPAAAHTWFFAAGRFEANLQERLVVFNPSSTIADVVVEIRPDNRAVEVQPFDLAINPGRYALLDLHSEARLSKDVAGYSVLVRSVGPPVVAERLITVTAGQPGAGAGATTGSSSAATTVYVDGGASGGGDPSAIAVFNPNRRAIARLTFAVIANGALTPAPPESAVEIGPGERVVLPFARFATGTFSVKIDATAPVVVERESVGTNVRSAAMGVPLRSTASIPDAVNLELGE